MNTAQRLGLPWWLDWLVSHSFWVTFLVAAAVFYVGHFGVGLVFESRLLPLWNGQYKSFFPGDLGLSFAFAAIVASARHMPVESLWLSSWWRGSVLIFMVILSLVMMFITQEPEEADRYLGYYLSPTRLYHGLLLIGGFGYILVTMGVPAMMWTFTHQMLWFLLIMVGVSFWAWWALWDFVLHPPTPNPNRPIHAPFSMEWLSWVRVQFLAASIR